MSFFYLVQNRVWFAVFCLASMFCISCAVLFSLCNQMLGTPPTVNELTTDSLVDVIQDRLGKADSLNSGNRTSLEYKLRNGSVFVVVIEDARISWAGTKLNLPELTGKVIEVNGRLFRSGKLSPFIELNDEQIICIPSDIELNQTLSSGSQVLAKGTLRLQRSQVPEGVKNRDDIDIGIRPDRYYLDSIQIDAIR